MNKDVIVPSELLFDIIKQYNLTKYIFEDTPLKLNISRDVIN